MPSARRDGACVVPIASTPGSRPRPKETLSSIELPPLPDAPPVVRTTAAPEPGAARRIQLPAVPRQGRGMVWVRRGAIAAAVVLAIWAVIAARQHVMSAVPFTARLYSMVGLGPVVPGQGLELRQVTPSPRRR